MLIRLGLDLRDVSSCISSPLRFQYKLNGFPSFIGNPTFPPAPGLPVPVNEVPLAVVGGPEVAAPVTVTQSPLVSLLPSSSVVRHPVLSTNSHVSSLTADVIKALKLNREAPTSYRSSSTRTTRPISHTTKLRCTHTTQFTVLLPNHITM